MKTNFILPSCNYNIWLSKEDLQQLLDTGHICVTPYRDVPCTTGRYVFDRDTSDFECLDRKEIGNNLRFRLDEPVADIEELDWHVQFLTINLEEKP